MGMKRSWRAIAAPCGRGDRRAGRARELGEVAARPRAQVLGAGVDLGEARAHLALLLRRDGAHLHERVDEEAERLIGGDAARRGVGLLQVAVLLEIGEHVADEAAERSSPYLFARVRLPTGSPEAMNSVTTAKRILRVRSGGRAWGCLLVVRR